MVSLNRSEVVIKNSFVFSTDAATIETGPYVGKFLIFISSVAANNLSISINAAATTTPILAASSVNLELPAKANSTYIFDLSANAEMVYIYYEYGN